MARKPIRKQRRQPHRYNPRKPLVLDKAVFLGERAVEQPAEQAAPANMRASVLDAASKAVNGSRDVAYGAPENNFARIAILWNAYLDARDKERELPLTDVDVAIFQIQLKVGRLAGNPSHIDSWVDIAGFAACGAEVASKS